MPQRRIALRLQYDGSAFHGAQRQAAAPSVQESLEDAIEALTQRPHRTVFAGRTDAVRERYYAISVERRIKHPAVIAILEAAREEIFV